MFNPTTRQQQHDIPCHDKEERGARLTHGKSKNTYNSSNNGIVIPCQNFSQLYAEINTIGNQEDRDTGHEELHNDKVGHPGVEWRVPPCERVKLI